MKKSMAVLLLFNIMIALSIAGCSNTENDNYQSQNTNTEDGNMKITSQAFENDGNIPQEYTCEGENTVPPLEISDIPEEAQSLALIADDPDAPVGTFVHWVVWNIAPQDAESGNIGGEEGINGFGKKGYGGPCPPSGTHRYFFKAYALDTDLELPRDAKKQDLERAMEGHMIEQAQLMGRYSRG